MPVETSAVSAAKAREAAAKIQWHPGFRCAVALELRENRDALVFESEYEVSRGPLSLDLLVIKKRKDVVLSNEIGRIFRTYNVCEFKSPDDGLTIDDYFKTLSYAGLVKASGETVNGIPAGEITLSFVRNSYPREMVRELTASGAVLARQFPGVYYLNRGPGGRGDVLFPTQIIVTGELDRKKHSTLRVLTRNAEEADVRLFLAEALSQSEKDSKENVDAVLQVSVSANMELFERIRRDDGMCQAMRELMKDEFQRVESVAERRGELRGERRGSIHSAVAIYRDELGLDDQAIIGRISSRFHLTGEQARAYVLPREAEEKRPFSD